MRACMRVFDCYHAATVLYKMKLFLFELQRQKKQKKTQNKNKKPDLTDHHQLCNSYCQFIILFGCEIIK